MAMAAYFCNEKVHKTMRTTIVSYLLNVLAPALLIMNPGMFGTQIYS